MWRRRALSLNLAECIICVKQRTYKNVIIKTLPVMAGYVVLVVAILHALKRKTLLSIVAGTICYMLLKQVVFV